MRIVRTEWALQTVALAISGSVESPLVFTSLIKSYCDFARFGAILGYRLPLSDAGSVVVNKGHNARQRRPQITLRLR